MPSSTHLHPGKRPVEILGRCFGMGTGSNVSDGETSKRGVINFLNTRVNKLLSPLSQTSCPFHIILFVCPY